ncbi:hypothetical protein [Streptomyces naphthomycinicus]|uniref:hypothetical protein n=1 Tax=Streptomyces naphthomycinicus TaxID=2872625 RepID=UPI00288C0142|nr:hypothetical protein [Streptomyces sp. TML10]
MLRELPRWSRPGPARATKPSGRSSAAAPGRTSRPTLDPWLAHTRAAREATLDLAALLIRAAELADIAGNPA